MKKLLPDNYKIARSIHLNKRLSELPAVTKGVHRGFEVYRVKAGGKLRVFRGNTGEGAKLKEIYDLRARLSSELKELKKSFKGDLDAASKGFSICVWEDERMGEEFYRKAVPGSSSYKYVLNGINFRSRVEMVIAQVLTDLGLEYKYECGIRCNGKMYSVDFLVFLPEFGRCFMIEYMGMLDDEGYVYKNSLKLRDYMTEGYYLGRDILVLSGNGFEMPSVDQIRIGICCMLETITVSHLTVFTF